MIALSVRELHIYVEQGLQRMGGFKKDFQWDQAIDIALTQAQNRIVKAKLLPGDTPYKFEVNAKYTSDIESLITLRYPLFVTKDPYFNQVTAQLPHDFGFLLGDSSLVTENCQPEFTIPNPLITVVERVIAFPCPNANDPGPYFQSIVIGVNSTNDSLTTPGFVTTDERVYIVDNIIEMFKSLGVECYWESYKNFAKQKTFYVVLRGADISKTIGITIDGKASAGVITDTSILTYADLSTVGSLAVNRDSKADYNGNLQASYYYTQTPDSPITIMNSDQLTIFQSKRFLVSQIFVDYIRKPKRISLVLDQNSDLSDTTHEEIADLAIRLLKKKIEDKSYELEVADTVKRIE